MNQFGLFLCFIIALATSGAKAGGEVDFLYSPASLKFSGNSQIQETLLKEVFSATLGLSVQENSDWTGLSVTDPFNTPEALVCVYVEGVSNLGKNGKSISYGLSMDEAEPEMFEAVSSRILQRYSDNNNNIVNIQLSDIDQVQSASVFGKVKVPKSTKRTLNYLKSNEDVDRQFLSEIDALDAIANAVREGAVTPDNSIDFYHLTFKSLHTLSDHYGSESAEVKEAKKLLNDSLDNLKDAFMKAYNKSVLVAVISSDSTHTRRMIRAAPASSRQEAQEVTSESLNAAPEYSADYPVIFNIILWFSVVYVFGLVAVVYAIMDMDPGRDSIIYRMTSMKMKKDN